MVRARRPRSQLGAGRVSEPSCNESRTPLSAHHPRRLRGHSMDRNWFRLVPVATVFVFFAGWMAIEGGMVRGQDEAEPAPPLTISPDEPIDRMSRIEARLRDLETHNRQLQQR